MNIGYHVAVKSVDQMDGVFDGMHKEEQAVRTDGDRVCGEGQFEGDSVGVAFVGLADGVEVARVGGLLVGLADLPGDRQAVVRLVEVHEDFADLFEKTVRQVDFECRCLHLNGVLLNSREQTHGRLALRGPNVDGVLGGGDQGCFVPEAEEAKDGVRGVPEFGHRHAELHVHDGDEVAAAHLVGVVGHGAHETFRIVEQGADLRCVLQQVVRRDSGLSVITWSRFAFPSGNGRCACPRRTVACFAN